MKQQKYVIGLNSGTSCDGIDAALVRFKKNDLKPIFIDGIVYEYPKIIKEKINNLISLQAISQLNFLLGELFANAALKIIKKKKLQSKDILLIGSHGQTIYHQTGKPRSTFQIGESSVIAEKTGIKTVSNFREADIACGGEGAPLMPYLDLVIFNKSKNIKAILNIGGISNITIVGENITPIAFDIGPGNVLIDLITKNYFKRDFDKDGKLAKKGKIHLKYVESALKDPYFKRKPPKSTGKEYFNLAFVKKYFSQIKKREDKLATVTVFTACAIKKALRDFILPKYDIHEIIISGGGLKNKTLINHLHKLLPKCKLYGSDKYKIPWKFKEAILFALLGYTCHLGRANNIPSCTGAKKKAILGKIIKI